MCADPGDHWLVLMEIDEWRLPEEFGIPAGFLGIVRSGRRNPPQLTQKKLNAVEDHLRKYNSIRKSGGMVAGSCDRVSND
ncbi:MAG: hypothetical protein KDA85_14610, partial [Planctomycetaceae bacterium]|nr:hypothetical protein [Planctomycetaceae bacterium]